VAILVVAVVRRRGAAGPVLPLCSVSAGELLVHLIYVAGHVIKVDLVEVLLSAFVVTLYQYRLLFNHVFVLCSHKPYSIRDCCMGSLSVM